MAAGLLMCSALLSPVTAGRADAATSFAGVIDSVQPKIVKIYGAGGVRGLEAYQSGFLVSADGHVLTVDSYVLDTEFITAVLDDGRRFQAEVLGVDPQLEIAILKVEAEGLAHFSLDSTTAMVPGARVLAFSNLFGVAAGDESASVLHGSVSAKTKLAARRGAFESPYRGPAYVLDAMTNNPGSAGGALTDRRGQLAGLLGKELRSSLDNTWINYALPISELRPSIESILAGDSRPASRQQEARKPAEPVTLSLLGMVLVPEVLPRTPAFVDRVVPDSSAAEAGLRPDDLVLFVNDEMARSAQELKRQLTFIDRIDEVRLLVQRNQQLIEMSLFAPDE